MSSISWREQVTYSMRWSCPLCTRPTRFVRF